MSPKLTPSQRRPQFQGLLRTKSFQVFILLSRFFFIISHCILKSRVSSKMRWSGTKLTKSSETEESGFTGPGPSSIRQTFLMLQAYDNLGANSKCVFFLTALPISPDRKENGVRTNKVAKRANQLNVCYKQVLEQGEANCERNLETFLRCIETVANTTQVKNHRYK